MIATVVVFPGSNCDRDVCVALETTTGRRPARVWHTERDLPPSDLIVLPGGFAHGDYLRAGAIAARAPVMREVVRAAGRGTPVLGICNGFQVLTECGLLPGVLLRNRGLRFVCRDTILEIGSRSRFTVGFAPGDQVRFPVAHAAGNYHASQETLDRLEGEGQVAFRYAGNGNPNGSQRDIAGITDPDGLVLGLMPHPERALPPGPCGRDGERFFRALMLT